MKPEHKERIRQNPFSLPPSQISGKQTFSNIFKTNLDISGRKKDVTSLNHKVENLNSPQTDCVPTQSPGVSFLPGA